MDQRDLEDKRKQLIGKRDEIHNRLVKIKRDLGTALDKDWEEQAVELENKDVLEELARVLTEELSVIERGLENIELALRQYKKK